MKNKSPLFFLLALSLSFTPLLMGASDLKGGGCGNNDANPSPTPGPATATVNTPLYSPGHTTEIIVRNTSTNAMVNPSVTLASWLSTIATDQNLALQGEIAPGEIYTFSFSVSDSEADILASRANYQYLVSNETSAQIQVSAENLADPINPELNVEVPPDPFSLVLWEDIITNADLWSDQPEMMSAGYGFEGIQGVLQGESYVIAAGGAWETVLTADPPYTALTSAKTPTAVSLAWGYPTYFADAMPICFSWPVLPSTVDRSNFAVTLNTGEIVTPYVASITPNLEYNERSCVVIFGEFGNRLSPGTEGAIYPSLVSIVDGLQLVGPNGPVSAVGLSKESTNPYTPNGGPTLNAAKLSLMSIAGEGVGSNNAFSAGYPNNGAIMYPTMNPQYRLRIYTTGGFSPDGVAALWPTDFSNFLQVVANEGGTDTFMTQTNVAYTFSAGSITIVGLADLGLYTDPLNDAYTEDNDNYIDIVLEGDDAAMRLITTVIIPTTGSNGIGGSYQPFYNPGGPGNNPTPGVTYTSPGPAWSQPVIMAIDDPLTVTYP